MNIKPFLGKIYVILMILFLYLPVIIMALLSFKSGSKVSFPIESFSLEWYIGVPKGYEYGSYISVLYDTRFFDAFKNSLFISFPTAFLTCFVVTATALALRRKVRGRDLLFYIILLGFIAPGVIVGLGAVIFNRALGLHASFWTPVFLDAIYAVPFGLVLMMSRFEPKLVEYERTALCLRASPFNVFRYITLPLIFWEVISAAIFGFLLAWSEIVRTQFVMRGTGVLSTYILTELQINPVTPKWYAAGTIVTLISLIALIIFGWIISRATSAKG